MTAAKAAAAAVPPVLEPLSGQIVKWPLEAIRESAWNPRRHYDPAALAQLAESITATGQVTPGLARPTADTIELDGDVWRVVELAAGHRRFRALRDILGAMLMRLEVREMDDTEFLEVLQVENLQRDNLDPLEEADGYRLLMERIGYGIDRVVERVGRPRAYIYDRLRLLKLVSAAQEWLRDGLLPLGQAVILSRLSPSEQERVIGTRRQNYTDGALWQGDHAWDVEDLERSRRDAPPQAGEGEEDPVRYCRPVSVRALQSWVDRHIRFRATEDEVAPELFPEAVEVEQTAEPIRVTYEHQVHPEARDAEGARTWCARSWKRADGLYGSVTCERSQPAIIVVGPGRGQALQACTAKKTCPVHWKSEMREAKRAEKRRAQEPATQAGKTVPAPVPVPVELTEQWLDEIAHARAEELLPLVQDLRAQLAELPADLLWNLPRTLGLHNRWGWDAEIWQPVNKSLRTNQAGAPGYPLDPGNPVTERILTLLARQIPGEWSNGDITWDTYMDVPAATSVVAIHLSILRWTAGWEEKVQEKLVEHEAQWRREQEAPAPIPCSDCGHDLTKAAPGKKAARPKKLAGDVRRAKKKAAKKRGSS